MKKLLVIIPAYNEQDSIGNVVNELIEKYPQFDYVVINDGSKDNTRKVCKENKFKLLDLPINLGLAGGFQAGMKYAYKAGYQYAIQFDADGQHKAEYIQKMLEKMEEGYDIVIGSRFVDEKKPFSMRMLGSSLISLAIRITTGKKIKDPTSGMRMFNRKLIKECAKNMNYGPEPDTISFLMKNGAVVSEVQVAMEDRVTGQSYLTPIRSISYMIRMLTSILVIQNFRKRDKMYAVEKQ